MSVIVFSFGYTMIMFSFFLLVIVISRVRIAGPKHHRQREIHDYSISITKLFEPVKEEETDPDLRSVQDNLEDWLESCNRPLGLNATSFLFFMLLYMVVLITGVIFFVLNSAFYVNIQTNSLLGTIMFWAMLFFGTLMLLLTPFLILRSVAIKYKRKIKRQFLYLLNYFQMYLRMGVKPEDVIPEIIPLIPNPLRARLIVLNAEIKVLGNEIAFRRFVDLLAVNDAADKTQFNIYKTFHYAIHSQIRLGSNASDVCRNLSKRMREHHKYNTVQKIQKKPLFVIIPKICFVASLFIIIVIPVIEKLFSFTDS
ncbi:MAG: hypothetical protein JWM44_2115 [Bacilli bacterium]|nr:hypothetical protein [Bacilli bacterium]